MAEYGILDTETTGLLEHEWARVIEIGGAVFDSEGDLFQPVRPWSSMVCPDVLIDEGLRVAWQISQITEAEIRSAPPAHEVWLDLFYEVDDLPILCWNTPFDKAMVRRSFLGDMADPIEWSGDVMIEFGELFRSVLGSSRHAGGGPRWVTLKRAMSMSGLKFPGGEQSHRAIGDCIGTGQIRQHMLRGLIGPPKENPKGLHGKMKFSF